MVFYQPDKGLIKATQRTKQVQLWLAAYTLCISEIRLTLQAKEIKQSTVT